MKKKLISGALIAILIFGVQLSLVVDSFPGFHGKGDCNLCHNNPATSYNSSYMDSEITLDGLATEEFWDSDITYYRKVYVPVGGSYGSAHMFVKMIFAQNSSHLFILASWEDATIDGTDTEMYEDSDGISIMFDINASDFDTGYGMKTREAGEVADIFTWKPVAAETGQETYQNGYIPKTTDGTVWDQSYDDSSWVDDLSQDWSAKAVHGNVSNHYEHHYQVEFVRALETDDPNDVQFSETKHYDFGVAIYNDSSAAGHYVSPVHSVLVFNPDDPDNDEKLGFFTVHETETVIEEGVTVTQVETETKSPLFILPVLLALLAVPVIIVKRRST